MLFSYNIGKNNDDINVFDRKAARAVIIKDNKILVLTSDNDEVKLPGGGLDKDESFIIALEREVLEETGYTVLSIIEFGEINTFSKSKEDDRKVFSMQSKCFLVEIDDTQKTLNLQGYEITENFKPNFISVDEAININEKALLIDESNEIAKRELIAFNEIKKYINNL